MQIDPDTRYLFRKARSARLRDRKAAQNNSLNRQSSSHMALLPTGLLPDRPYLMVRSISSCARANAPSALESLPAWRAFSTREVSLPMFAICCGKDISAHRTFSREVCCIYPIINCPTICLIASRISGSSTSRVGFFCQDRMLIKESYSMKSSPSSSGYRLNPHKSSPAEPFSNSRGR